MGEPQRRRAERNAGAFLGTDGVGMIPVPMSTLSDEYHDEPVDPEDDREPAPDPPGRIRRLIDRLGRRSDAAP